MNNEMDDFVAKPGCSEYVWPGGRRSKCDSARQTAAIVDGSDDLDSRTASCLWWPARPGGHALRPDVLQVIAGCNRLSHECPGCRGSAAVSPSMEARCSVSAAQIRPRTQPACWPRMGYTIEADGWRRAGGSHCRARRRARGRHRIQRKRQGCRLLTNFMQQVLVDTSLRQPPAHVGVAGKNSRMPDSRA